MEEILSDCDLPNRHSSKYWGTWFSNLNESDDLKQTNLNIFYHLGVAMEDLRDLSTGQELTDVMLHVVNPIQWCIAPL